MYLCNLAGLDGIVVADCTLFCVLKIADLLRCIVSMYLEYMKLKNYIREEKILSRYPGTPRDH